MGLFSFCFVCVKVKCCLFKAAYTHTHTPTHIYSFLAPQRHLWQLRVQTTVPKFSKGHQDVEKREAVPLVPPLLSPLSHQPVTDVCPPGTIKDRGTRLNV